MSKPTSIGRCVLLGILAVRALHASNAVPATAMQEFLLWLQHVCCSMTSLTSACCTASHAGCDSQFQPVVPLTYAAVGRLLLCAYMQIWPWIQCGAAMQYYYVLVSNHACGRLRVWTCLACARVKLAAYQSSNVPLQAAACIAASLSSVHVASSGATPVPAL